MIIAKRNARDEKMVKLVGDAITEVMIPAMEAMEERLKSELASKEDLNNLGINLRKDMATKDQVYDAIIRLDSIDEKLDKLSRRQNYQEEEIQDIKKAIAFS